MLSPTLSRYYEPLRLPRRSGSISGFALYVPVGSTCTAIAADLPSCTVYLPLHATRATPGQRNLGTRNLAELGAELGDTELGDRPRFLCAPKLKTVVCPLLPLPYCPFVIDNTVKLALA
jgi:hypothetical protein